MTAYCKKDPNAPAKGSIVLLDHCGNHVEEGKGSVKSLRGEGREIRRERVEHEEESHKTHHDIGYGHSKTQNQRSAMPSIIEID